MVAVYKKNESKKKLERKKFCSEFAQNLPCSEEMIAHTHTKKKTEYSTMLPGR